MNDIRLFLVFGFSVLYTSVVFAQETSLKIDSKYLEDQLYFGFSYNSLLNTPKDFVQNGFSYGTSLGFIKDIPLNKRRNIGLAVGLGYAYNTYNQNLLIQELNGVSEYSIIESYSSNRYHTKSVEFPIEFRWRTSSLEKYKFWRVYGGLTFSYILDFNSKAVIDSKTYIFKNSNDIEKFQYALSLAAGYGTWNFYVSYALTSVFKKSVSLKNGQPLDLKNLRLGLMFYMF